MLPVYRFLIRLHAQFKPLVCWLACLSVASVAAQADHSVARQWNEALLHAIRQDLARPTVHARNLFHTAVVMYDAWAAYDEQAQPYLLGRRVGSYLCPFGGITRPSDVVAAQETAISYAAYRLLSHRFFRSPGYAESQHHFDSLMRALGHDPAMRSTDFSDGSPAALGNYLAQCMIEYGLQDGANEGQGYINRDYTAFNDPFPPAQPGAPGLGDPNRWQPLSFREFIDQSGNPSASGTPDFVGAEWGRVQPFAMDETDRQTYQRDGQSYQVYHDPGPPPLLGNSSSSVLYQLGFALVAMWSAHLDPSDSVRLDISPGNLGNLSTLPSNPFEIYQFYDPWRGGDPSAGHSINPATEAPYAPQRVLRGDYTRVLAEFWADGPDSETPPGHWFTLLNYVHDHPAFVPRYRGTGPLLPPLEWDVKAYLALGGAMHDAAIAAWSVKGYYDYVRPISAIRHMATLGQSSDPNSPQYHPEGLPLFPGLIEQVQANDPLFGPEAVGKVKLYAWRGPDYISNPESDDAGVGWILAENWWPYQRPTFVTPPFAGYVSGHSTFSRAAAEVLTLLTGDAYFPGGMGEFVARKNDFLVFEEGPSEDLILQWATYRDASDQTSLSRIWGGIHPPADDIPGRLMGQVIGPDAVRHAERYFRGEVPSQDFSQVARCYPNPVVAGQYLSVFLDRAADGAIVRLVDLQGRTLVERSINQQGDQAYLSLPTTGLVPGLYLIQVVGPNWRSGDLVRVEGE
jgi:hypothetical protein